MEPSVSVIVPTHSRPLLLKRAIQSVLNQSYPDFEILVVENGGATAARQVVDEFRQPPSRLRYFFQREANPNKARNLGIEHARGGYIAFLDDDDEWLLQKLEHQLKVAQQSPEIGLVSCRAWCVDPEGNAEIDSHPQFHGIPSFKALIVEWCWIWSLSGVLIRSDCFERLGLFKLNYLIAADYEFYLRLARLYRVEWINEPLFRYRVHSNNLTRDMDLAWKETLQVLRSLRPAPELGVPRTAIREAIVRYCRWYYALAVDARDTKRYRKAVTYFYRAVSFDPLIGNRIDWSRVRHPLYRWLRPYVGILLCSLQSLLQIGPEEA